MELGNGGFKPILGVRLIIRLYDLSILAIAF